MNGKILNNRVNCKPFRLSLVRKQILTRKAAE